MKILLCVRFALLMATLVLTSCGGGAQKYYQLSADGPVPTGNAGITLAVGPVTLPAYVDRAELVFQSGPNEFEVPPDAHWAGSLKENISRVLAADLGRRLGSGNVLSFPWNPTARPRYQIAIDVSQFHAISGQGAVLEAAWRLETPDGKATIRRGNAIFHEPIAGDGYGPVVSAENNLLGQLADAMTPMVRGR